MKIRITVEVDTFHLVDFKSFCFKSNGLFSMNWAENMSLNIPACLIKDFSINDKEVKDAW